MSSAHNSELTAPEGTTHSTVLNMSSYAATQQEASRGPAAWWPLSATWARELQVSLPHQPENPRLRRGWRAPRVVVTPSARQAARTH